MKHLNLKHIRLSQCEKDKINKTAKVLGITVSVLFRHWINDTPVIGKKDRDMLKEMKVTIKNTGSNITQLRQHIENTSGDMSKSVMLRMYMRDLRTLHWRVREKCLHKYVQD